MMHVKTYLDKDNFGGIGLFADEHIKKGALVWQPHPFTEKVFSKEEYQKLPSQIKVFVKKYAYSHTTPGNIVLNIDDARFFNHSENPNVVTSKDDGELMVAAQDINRGEELTSNYLEDNFDGEMELCASFLKSS